MKIIYGFNSGFLCELESCKLAFDYWRGLDEKTIDGFLSGEKPVYALVSHGHGDHYNPQILNWVKKNKNLTYIFSSDIQANSGVHFLEAGDIFQDEVLKVRAFGSTDLGVSFALEVDGLKIFHAGDLNNWHWAEESTSEEIAQAEESFLAELEKIAASYPVFNVAMFPVDPRMGKDYDRGARQFTERIKVQNFIPMHYGLSYTGERDFGERFWLVGNDTIAISIK